MDLTFRQDHNGVGRELTPDDQKKVAVAEITYGYAVDVITLRAQKAAFSNGDSKKLTKMPGDGGWNILEGEMAFKMRHNSSNAVLTTLNGLEEGPCRMFPDNPTLVRDIVASMIQPIGIVREDARTDMQGPMVALRVGGLCPFGAPGAYNVPGTEDKVITSGGGVVFDVPNLVQPLQFGNPESGRPLNKVTLIARPYNKTMIATRALNLVSHLIHDPIRFQQALELNEHVANCWIKLGFRMLDSYTIAHLMALNQDLRRVDAIGGRGAPFLVNPAFTELLGPTALATGAVPRSEEVIANYAELIGLLAPGRAVAGLTAAQRQYWAEHQFAQKNVLLPTPHHTSKSYNAAYAFGFTQRGPNGSIESIATSGDTVRRTPIGELYKKSLVHSRLMLESMAECGNEERRLNMGVSHSTPNQRGTGIFNFQLIPGGGVGDIV